MLILGTNEALHILPSAKHTQQKEESCEHMQKVTYPRAERPFWKTLNEKF
jgi:hypothetical protein